jgi:polyisoprenoid-binding protein YceI
LIRRISLLAAVVAVVLAAVPALPAVTKYEADVAHSNVGFAVPILGGLSRVRGKFNDFNVSITYDDADVTKSSVTATIKAASVDTGIERRDAHLRRPDFFDAEKFPEITFQSKRIEKRGDKEFVAHGTFTMRGVAKEIALPFTINGVQKSPDGKTTLGVTARTTVNRKDYGVSFANPQSPDFLGDVVEIELNVVTRAAAPEGAAPATPAATK